MRRSHTIWPAAFLGLLATALIVRLRQNPAYREATGHAHLEASQTSAESAPHRRPKHAQEPLESTVAVPLVLIPMMYLPVFEEDTGDLCGDFITAFQFTQTEKTELRQMLKCLLSEFGKIERQHAQHVSKDGDSFILLNPCAAAAAPVFRDLKEASSKKFGKGRGEAVAILLERQLRDGGKIAVEISFVTLGDGQVLLSKRILSESGDVVSNNEGQHLRSPDFHELARWSHLDKLD